ncbi:toprim domain-containing protein [Pseudocnuella soli]|uniref:toprim domain-containing protein n=1 Tax=Pseudocnuella soli TaxID=2502779 RepID=UPI00104B5B67|nr:toprim domain-containing protein [Pseudocnuella soli]
MKQGLRCVDARNMDLVSYLETLGFKSEKVRGQEYWYCSPLREEKTSSFKVDRSKNLWYDHGIGKGGNLVDFGVLFYGCSVKEFLQKLEGKTRLDVSFHPSLSAVQKDGETERKKLEITAVKPIESAYLWHYINRRKIAPHIARQYLKEVSFELNGRPHSALGLPNNSGGYELRNAYFKGSSSPKDVTLIGPGSEEVAVFEGCFSFLSYLSLAQKKEVERSVPPSEGPTSFLVLNSLSFMEKSRGLMECYPSVHLYLDRDAAGLNAMQQALQWSQKYQDKSALYEGHKDLNDFLIHQLKTGKSQGRRRGLHF